MRITPSSSSALSMDREHGSDGVHLPRPVGVLGIGLGIVNMNGAPLESGARRAAPASGWDGMLLHERDQLGGSVVVRHGAEKLTVKTVDECALGPAQPDRVLRQRLEDRLEIERGPPDHLEELAGGRLLIEGDPQLAV